MTDPAASLRAAHDAVTRLVNLYFDRVPVEHLDRELLAETIHEGLSDEWDRLYRIEAATVPPPADRAAILREAADRLDESKALRDLTDDHMHDVHAAANELRRMADETPATIQAAVLTNSEQRCPHGCDVSRCPCLACEAEQDTEAPEDAETECAHCWRLVENRSTPNMGGPAHDHWVHMPGGFTLCFPQRPDSPRAEPRMAAEARQDGAQS